MKLAVCIVLEDRCDASPRDVATIVHHALSHEPYFRLGARLRRFTIEDIEVEEHCEPNEGRVFAAVQSRSAKRIDVMLGHRWVATACSKTMAKRIARSLNIHKPNREGV